MILYSSSAGGFVQSVRTNAIVDEITEAFVKGFGKQPNPKEKTAWTNSLRFMETVIQDAQIANDCGVLIEYNIPSTSKRVDFIVTGKDEEDRDNFVILELKQWDEAKTTDKEEVVKSFVAGREREVTHPSYQAWSYQEMISNTNAAVHESHIICHSCAYLHNYKEKDPEPLKAPQYKSIKCSPIFFKDDYKKLEDFLYQYIGKGKGMEILYRIENGQIKPSKKLIEHVEGLFKGNKEFILIDEQKVAYSTIIKLAEFRDKKRTIIVKGGPGTGKSVVSMNAFGELLKKELNVKFVAPNASFRTVLMEMLARNKENKRNRINFLFAGSSQFYNSGPDDFDVLIVDEAHRLKKKGAYQYRGENQVEDIIKASKTNVFFIDDSQRIRPDDIGSVSEIKRIAEIYNSEIYEIELEAQFRCSGAEGFINWLDTVLQIRDTGNFSGWDKEAFDFKIADTPNDLFDMISKKNEKGYKSRMLAGFAWKWSSEKEGNKNGEIDDVTIPEHDFQMPWNGRSISYTWALDDSGVNQIGCVHTSQGLEFDYVGVIIGNDLKFNPDSMTVYASYDEYKDSVGKKGLKNNPEELTKLISNIYKILMSRGMKGCYIYCRDQELQNHFRERLTMSEQFD